MIRRIMYIKLKDGVTPKETERFEDLMRQTPKQIPCVTWSTFGKNLYDSQMPPGIKGPWSYVWDFAIDQEKNIQTYNKHPYHVDVLIPVFRSTSPTALVENLTFIYFEPKVFSSKNREAQPSKQQLAYAFREGITQKQIADFDRMMLEMPKNIPQMRNFCLGTGIRPAEISPWNRVWEWEFMTQEDFQYYLDHKAHMDVVPLFNGADSERLVSKLTNAQYRLDRSIITY